MHVLKWALFGVLGLLVLVLVLIYLPPVQDLALSEVLKKVNSSGVTHIDACKVRLLFPIRLQADSVSFSTQGMQIDVTALRTKVEFLPLLTGNVSVPTLKINEAKVVIGTPDSAMYMNASLRNASLSGTTIALMSSAVDAGLLSASDGNVQLAIGQDTVPKPAGESTPVNWSINLKRIELRNITYGMTMYPSITALNCILPYASLHNGLIDLAQSRIDVSSLNIKNVDARYITPTAEYLAQHPAVAVASTSASDSLASVPWSIKAGKISLTDSHAIYATDGAVPTENFNPAFIEASEIAIEVDSFFNRGMEITVPIRKISARERCGIALNLTGTFAMDSAAMYARDMRLNTPASLITLDAMMGMHPGDVPIMAKLDATLAVEDLERLVPQSAGAIVGNLPRYQPVILQADVDGTMNNVNLQQLSAEIPNHIALAAKGHIADYSDINKASGKVDISGSITNGKFVKTALLPAKMGKSIDIPRLRVSGDAVIANGKVNGSVKAVTGDGNIALNAMWNNRVEGYKVKAEFNDFPVQSILPTAGVKDLDAEIAVDGQGLDFLSSKTEVKANMHLNHVEYNGHQYENVIIDAQLQEGNASVRANSNNRAANFTLDAAGNLAGEKLDWKFNGDIRNIDLRALALTDSLMQGSITINGNATYIPAVASTRRHPGCPMMISANVEIPSFTWHMGEQTIASDNIKLQFLSDSTTTDALVRNNDLMLTFDAPVPLDTLLKDFSATSSLLNADIAQRRINIDSLQRSLPPLSFMLRSGTGSNLLNSYLSGMDMSVRTVNFQATNDTVIAANGLLAGIKKGTTRVDTLRLNLHQRGAYLLYDLVMHNNPGTFDQFADVSTRGYISDNTLALIFKQQNIEGATGYSLGLMAQITDSTNVNLRFVPFHPVIGYKDWEINRNNRITFNLENKHFGANLFLHNDESSLHLFTDTIAVNDSVQAPVNLKISDIKLADWIAINPFAPPITGDLSADMKLNITMPDVSGSGNVALTNFFYNRRKVGDFNLDLDLATNGAGTIRAATSLSVDGQKAITVVGNLNDSTAANPFMLDFRMIHFPLSVADPFLPKGTANLTGWLNGKLDVTGELTAPQFNGFLDFDSTAVNLEMLGTAFRFSEDKIPMENNVVKFDNFEIFGANSEPLRIDGTINLEAISDPRINLNLLARNMQVVNSQKSRRSQAYGKAYIDLTASAKGNLNFLKIDAELKVNPGTNVTYIIPDAVSTLTSRSAQDMVRFVNFNDTTQVVDVDSIAPSGMMMDIDAHLNISTGTTIAVDLSADGKDRVQLQSNGMLTYTQDYMGDQRVSGRLNLPAGYVRYNLPVMGEKLFNFQEGSYVSFNGDMMNPILNVHAVDKIRANVSVNNNNRVVDFDAGLSVTGTLNDMNVAFDLSCPDDITIANELKSMTPEQRANQAMNLLISGVYRSGDTQTISGGNAGTNALFGFLESQLNSWASSAIHGVDISFGINQYDKTVNGANTTAMNYSYQVSKSLFNDRFKIVVGGNYTTDAEADENFAQNLIADISFEYMLNRAGTMYVRIFRHTGYESILEGEITQTGVGFVYKKKIQRIADIFKFLRRKKRSPKPSPALPAPADAGMPKTVAKDEDKK